jgi:hypothetical protein
MRDRSFGIGVCDQCHQEFVKRAYNQKICGKECRDLKAKKEKQPWHAARFWVFARDKFTCTYCGRNIIEEPGVGLEIEHVLPRSYGGKNTFYNLTTACHRCNTDKACGVLPLDLIFKIWERNKNAGIPTPFLAANEIIKTFNKQYPDITKYDLKKYFNITYWADFKDVEIVEGLKGFDPELFK